MGRFSGRGFELMVSTERRRVLVVDDDTGVRAWIKDRLAERGYCATTAGDGQEALALLQEGRAPDAIVLDLMMPGMSGWEFLDAKADDEKLRAVPVLVMTSHQHPPIDLKYVVGLFRKPDELARLIDTLERHLK